MQKTSTTGEFPKTGYLNTFASLGKMLTKRSAQSPCLSPSKTLNITKDTNSAEEFSAAHALLLLRKV